MRPIDADHIHNKLTKLYKNAQEDARKAYSCALDIVCDEDTIDCEPIINAEWINSSPLTDTIICSNCDYNIPDIELVTPRCPWCGAHMKNFDDIKSEIFDILDKHISELREGNKSKQENMEFNHEAFYEFLLNVINPNEMEKYRSMFLSSGEAVN